MKNTTFLSVILLLIQIVSFSAEVQTDTIPDIQNDRLSATETTRSSRDIELVSATQHGVKIQLSISKSDFKIGTQERNGKSYQTLSFPGSRYTTEYSMPRLPFQATLIGVPSDTSFTVQVVDSSDFSTYKLQYKIADNYVDFGREDTDVTALKSNAEVNAVYTTNRFFPHNLAKIGTAGWIRENRVLPIQLNPVQYNPVTGVVKLYHRLVVEVQFNRLANAPSALQGLPRPESAAYEEMLGNLLVNPQSAKQWRSPVLKPLQGRDSIPNGSLTEPNPHFSLASAPTLITPQYKVYIRESGMYRITGSDLVAAGIDISTIRPATIAVSNKGNQVPIYVRSTVNGRSETGSTGFSTEGEIIFYAQRLSGEKTYIHPYSDDNVYWISWNGGPGLRMETKALSTEIPIVPLDASGFPIYTSPLYVPKNFLTRVHVEKDNQFRRFKNFGLDLGDSYSEISSGLQVRGFTLTSLPDLPDDSWFWTQISAPEARIFNFTIDGVAGTGHKATARVVLHGRSEDSHFVELWLNNDIIIGTPRWEGETQHISENQQVSQSYLKNGRNTITAVMPSEGQELDLVMLNWFEIDYWRTYEAKDNVLPFSITPLPDDETGHVNPNFKVELLNFTDPNINIYSVDGTRYVGLAPEEDEDNPGVFSVEFQSSRIGSVPQYNLDGTLKLNTDTQYIALTNDQYLQPEKIIKDTPSDLRGLHNGADYIIITDTEFVRDVQPLANFRSQQGLRSKVVTVEDIYDEFNHGIKNPYALRDFLKYAYENWQSPAPTYVLLMGDANPKERTNFVPTIQVQVPGYGSSASDHQFVTFKGKDSFPEMLIGRVPANNSVDVRIFVERAINYETTNEIGPWHKRILMLAGSSFDFHSQTDTLTEDYHLSEKYEDVPIYAPATVEEEINLGEGTTPVGRMVIDGFNDGAILVNYVGHGAGGVLASSRMMGLQDPHQNLTNISQLPFMLSMTCFTGEFDSRSGCLAEELLRSKSGGAIAVVGGTSIGLLLQDHILNKKIFDSIFIEKTQKVGAILAEAKTQFVIDLPGYPDIAEVFTLFGDPATQLRLPHKQHQLKVETDKVLHRDVFQSGTLLSVSGTLPNTDFSGEAEITVLPKPIDRRSKKRRSQFRSSDTPLIRGVDTTPRKDTVSVVDGKFTSEIEVPYNSAFESWHIRTYAWNGEEDAIGYSAYNPLSQYIDNVRHEPAFVPPEQPVHVFADVVNQSAIEEITLFWSTQALNDRYTEATEIPMVLQGGEGKTYRTEQPIPAHEFGELIDYYILVRPKTGRVLQTEVVTYSVGKADLSFSGSTLNWDSNPPYNLSVQVRNAGTLDTKDVPVRFFYISLAEDAEIPDVTIESLQEATPIGEVQLIPQIAPEGFASVSVPWQPDPGRYLVAVVVDMPTAQHPNGIISEEREYNNIVSREFVNSRVFLDTEDTNKPIQSDDGRFNISIPHGNLGIQTALTIQTEELNLVNQPDITYATTEDGLTPPVAYKINFTEQTVETTGTASFKRTVEGDLHIYMHDDVTKNWIRIGKQEDDGENISAKVKLPGTYALLSHTDFQPPTITVTVENQGFIDGDYISDTPTITARIEDANGIDTRAEKIILTKNGERIPQDEYAISTSPANSNILLITYSPTDALEAGEYRIRLQAHDANGNEGDSGLTANVAGGFQIKNIANFPNPFRPGTGAGKGTDFAYYLTEGADKVTLKIYTLTGKLITTIDTLDASTSYNEYHFEGLDADGDPLANGVYIYKFTATKDDDRVQKVGKIVVLK